MHQLRLQDGDFEHDGLPNSDLITTTRNFSMTWNLMICKLKTLLNYHQLGEAEEFLLLHLQKVSMRACLKSWTRRLSPSCRKIPTRNRVSGGPSTSRAKEERGRRRS